MRSNSTKKLGALCLVLVLVMSTLGLVVGHPAGTQDNELFQDSGELGVYERYPENKSVGVDLNETLGADLNVSVRDDTENNVNVTFYGNMSGETLDQINSTSNIPDGDWANYTWEGLEYGTEYEWYVDITESGNETNYNVTETWTFKTEQLPNMPELVTPGDGDEVSIYPGMNTTLEVNVTHPEGKPMNVTFYDGDGVEIGNVTNVGDGLQNVPWENLEYGTQYTWYVNVTEYEEEDVNYTESATWSFTTEEVITDRMPVDGAPDVELGENRNTTIQVNVTHPTGDDMNVTFYGNQSGEDLDWLHKETVADGNWANYNWEGLDYNTEYTWYVEIANATTGEVITTSSNWSFTTQEEYFSLTIDSTEGGEVVDPGEDTFNKVNGTTVELEAVSNEGYHFVEWTGDNGRIDDTTANATSIEMLDDYEITAEFAEDEEEFFKVEIIKYDEEAAAGEYLMVKFTVENTGDVEGTQNINFSVDESVEDSKEVTLEPGENDTLKFFWKAETGSYLLTVASDDDEDTVDVTVETETAALPGMPGFTSLLLVLATIFAIVIYHKKQR